VRAQVDVYAFSMIAYELFEGAIPFGHLHPVEAARRAAMNHARPTWGKYNRQASPPTFLPKTSKVLLAVLHVKPMVCFAQQTLRLCIQHRRGPRKQQIFVKCRDF
jgi:hypothetical protein